MLNAWRLLREPPALLKDVGGRDPENVGQMGRFWAVTMGSTIGMVVADAIAIGIGRLLGKKIPELLMRRVSGVIFIVFGLFSIGSVLFG